MGTIIKEIKIPNDKYSFVSENVDDKNILKNLSTINILVGENNSGKSRFLRSIIKKKDFEFLPDNEDFDKINENIPNLKINFEIFFEGCDFDIFSYIQDLQEKIDQIKEVDYLVNEENFLQPILDLKALFQKLLRNEDLIGEYYQFNSVSYKWIGEKLIETMENTFNLNKPLEEVILDYKFKKLYIPIMRGLRPLLDGQNYDDLYKKRTGDAYFGGYSMDILENNNINVFTGLDAYNTVNLYSRLDPQKRKLLKDFKEYLKNNFFDGKNIEITASVTENGSQDVLSIKIGDEHEKPIHDLGDGIQSILILTLYLFLHKNENLLIFIEEPEQLLHPGLQRKLIETFLYEEGFENFQFFFTTHSNHFLDITLDFDDISIFTVKKELDDSDDEEKVPSFTIENLSERDNSVLELLGVRNSSVFLSNCTIWVEGITDRYYIRKYLEVFQNHLKEKAANEKIPFIEFREDYHYSFVEYAGSNITHWSFLEGLDEEEKMDVKRLCSNVFLIADKDDEEEKVDRKQILRENLGENFCLLTCREIENLLTEKTLLKVLKEFEYRNEEEMDKLNPDNFKRETYIDEPIGRFIKTVILKDLDKTRKYEANSGTLDSNIKLDFCKKAINHITDINDLSDDAIGLCNCIYQFIAKENGYTDLCEKLGIPECNSNKGCQKVEDVENIEEMD